MSDDTQAQTKEVKTEETSAEEPKTEKALTEEPKVEETTPEETMKPDDSVILGNETTPESKEEDSGQARMTTEEKSESKEPESTEPETTEPAQEAASPAKNDNPNAKWYVVHTYSGHENKVAHTLKQRIDSEHLENTILDILVPTQEKIEIKGGKKVNIKEKIFPGYILVKMVLDDISWLAVRTTQGVTSFVGMSNKPTPISDAEVATIVKFAQTEAPMYKQVFMANDTVKIVDGPFADFIGKIDSVDEERSKVKVLVSIFGRETPV